MFTPQVTSKVDAEARPDSSKAATEGGNLSDKKVENASKKRKTRVAAMLKSQDAEEPKRKHAKLRKVQNNSGAESKAGSRLSELQAQLAAAEAENKRLKLILAEQQLEVGEALGGLTEPIEGQPVQKKEMQLKVKQRRHAKQQDSAAEQQSLLAQKQAAEQNELANESGPGNCKGTDQGGLPAQPQSADITAWKPFELEEEIERALSALGFSNPTPIQQECLPAAIRDCRDVIGAAQTGSGKTLAFGLPIIQAMLAERKHRVPQQDCTDCKRGSMEADRKLRALILIPTRELAMQVCSHLQAVAKPCGVWVVPIVGGISAPKQERLLKHTPEVVVATPGRLWELMREGAPHLTDLQHLSFLVLDEADRMVQQGQFEELSDILEFVKRRGAGAASGDDEQQETPAEKKRKGHKLQTFVFSATLTMPEGLRKRLKKGGGGASGSVTLENLMGKVPFRDKPKIADLTSTGRLAEKISEAYLECTEENRDDRLYYLLTQHPGRTLIFTNAISTVRRLAAVLKLLQLPVWPLHASMQQRQRLKALDRFRENANAILVATDVAARGLDIPEVACVIHYQIPAAMDVYVHRCGRTARAEAEGISVAFVTPKESTRFTALTSALGRGSPPLFPLDHRLLEGAHRRVRLATRLDGALKERSKKSADSAWRLRTAEAAGIELSDEEEMTEAPSGKTVDTDSIQEELSRLLQEPLQPKYSQRFFAGTPSAWLLEEGRKRGSKEEGRMEGTEAVTQAVKHATRLVEARSQASAAMAEKSQRQKKKQKKLKEKAAVTRESALAAALAKQKVKKGGKKSRFVVIPGSVARETSGPNALEALRRTLTAIGS